MFTVFKQPKSRLK